MGHQVAKAEAKLVHVKESFEMDYEQLKAEHAHQLVAVRDQLQRSEQAAAALQVRHGLARLEMRLARGWSLVSRRPNIPPSSLRCVLRGWPAWTRRLPLTSRRANGLAAPAGSPLTGRGVTRVAEAWAWARLVWLRRGPVPDRSILGTGLVARVLVEGVISFALFCV